MNEKFSLEGNDNERAQAPAFDRDKLHEKKLSEYREVRGKVDKLIDAAKEAHDILTYNEKPCKSKEEETIAYYDVVIDGVHDLAEKYAYKNEYHKEKYARAAAKRLENQRSNKGIDFTYPDMREMAQHCDEEINEAVSEEINTTADDRIESGAADDYRLDGEGEKAA